MKLLTVRSEGLAHNSYFLFDDSEAVVVDPRRDCRIYAQLAKKTCTKIRYILETHRNEDYVVGSLELRELTKAEIFHGKQLPFKYGTGLEDQETLRVGNLQIQALHTPGHTDESFCYAVIDSDKTKVPTMVFTGDTLFLGSIGRTDLQGKKAQPGQAEKLHASLREKLLPLGDGVLVYPAHGAGSVCGSGINDHHVGTLGHEKEVNPYLKMSKDAFMEAALAQELVVPRYFARMEELNLNGPPRLRGLPLPRPLEVDEFEAEMMETDSVVVDTRKPYAFVGSHIPRALSFWLGGGTAVYAAWVLDYNQRMLFVTERKHDVMRATRHFWRVGFDNIFGYLCNGMNSWQEDGRPISHAHTLPPSELKERFERYVVLDVREPSEWHGEGTIDGAQKIFFVDLTQEADRLNRNRRYAVICSVGNRSSIAVSILRQKGFGAVSNVLGGMTAWQALGYPTVRAVKNGGVPAIVQ
jgi:hydroxyacylglutathione hydrolase